MAVDDKNVIDIVSIDKDDTAVLTISDHLEWDTGNEHILILQDKINSYLGAIESGDLYDKYPNAKSKNIKIRVVAKYLPNKDGEQFLKQTKEFLKSAGYDFTLTFVNT